MKLYVSGYIPSSPQDERISHIGYKDSGQIIVLSREEAIRKIKNLGYHFHVSNGGKRVKVVIKTLGLMPRSKEYLTTEPDGEKDNNLGNLPECL